MVIRMHAKNELIVIEGYAHGGRTICVKLAPVIRFDTRQTALPLKGGKAVERCCTRKTRNS